MDLEPEEGRIIGALVEKQLTTPQQYPLTLNALLSACNQTSSRDPIVSYDERTVESALVDLKNKGLVRFVHPSHGRSATRYRQVIEEALSLDTRQLALLAVLLLRGPQTPGELRARVERLVSFASPGDVEAELEALTAREKPLVVRLPRQLGRKEMRYDQLLARRPDDEQRPSGGEPSPRWTAVPERRDRVATAEPEPSLAAEVVALRAEVDALRRDLDEVMSQLDL